jgi:phosphohistidine phosphatase
MKTLLLMRHAKSSWKDTKLADHERPLNKRGRKDAPVMGQLLVDRELVPQLILSSSALRARQTAEVVAETADYTGEITYLNRLFMAEVEELIAVLRETPDDIERVMLIGHNPGLESLLQTLIGQIVSFPTAVIAHLSLPIDSWAQLSQTTSGELIEIWRPKEVRGEGAHEEEEDKEEEEKNKGKSKAKVKAQEPEKEKEKEKENPKSKDKEKGKAKKKGK